MSALYRFRQHFLAASSNRLISEEDFQTLERGAAGDGLDMRDALGFIRGDALHFLERALSFFFADGEISDAEDAYVRALLNLLAIPPAQSGPLLERLAYLRHLSAIRRGRLPAVPPRFHLESDETCHMDMGATYYKVNARSTTPVPGRFVATNKKLYFLAPSGGFEIMWKRIMRIERTGRGIYLELSTKKGNGEYDVTDPMLAEAVIEALVKVANRGLIAQMPDSATRHIPQDVKIAVWQRDQGKCVQCGATTYLEFDHVIPFSKGGASTVNNVQLLCRKCNLSKGGRL